MTPANAPVFINQFYFFIKNLLYTYLNNVIIVYYISIAIIIKWGNISKASTKPQEEQKALCLAIENNQYNEVLSLLQKGVSPDTYYEEEGVRMTALHLAVFQGFHSITKLLLTYKANQDLLNDEESSPLETAVINLNFITTFANDRARKNAAFAIVQLLLDDQSRAYSPVDDVSAHETNESKIIRCADNIVTYHQKKRELDTAQIHQLVFRKCQQIRKLGKVSVKQFIRAVNKIRLMKEGPEQLNKALVFIAIAFANELYDNDIDSFVDDYSKVKTAAARLSSNPHVSAVSTDSMANLAHTGQSNKPSNYVMRGGLKQNPDTPHDPQLKGHDNTRKPL
jgi:hypothetical protein